MDRLKVESKAPAGKWVIWSSCLLICTSLFLTRIVSSAAEGTPVKVPVADSAVDLSDTNSLFHEAYTTWSCNRQFDASQALYRRLFASGAGTPFMHAVYADMLTENGKKEEALREYRLGFATKSDSANRERSVLTRYATVCRSSHRDAEANWAEEQARQQEVAPRSGTSVSASSLKPTER